MATHFCDCGKPFTPSNPDNVRCWDCLHAVLGRPDPGERPDSDYNPDDDDLFIVGGVIIEPEDDDDTADDSGEIPIRRYELPELGGEGGGE